MDQWFPQSTSTTSLWTNQTQSGTSAAVIFPVTQTPSLYLLERELELDQARQAEENYRRRPLSSQELYDRDRRQAYERSQELIELEKALSESAKQARVQAEHSRKAAAHAASEARTLPQPRNTHHRSLRGYADAPRRPCYRGSR